ncbi:hypothetical protein PCASD_01312 [Puccinia coronata f. sp. avenae]|uniref:DH domain-containing protein n=1 Tax=Puccinia coronata f. sp. avenae TaxID=200324 RepID=A0A2N5VJ03_9BASI|nr:hypothetical protein PCASD_01312 [Puccinia coronata f. sp. avenae]
MTPRIQHDESILWVDRIQKHSNDLITTKLSPSSSAASFHSSNSQQFNQLLTLPTTHQPATYSTPSSPSSTSTTTTTTTIASSSSSSSSSSPFPSETSSYISPDTSQNLSTNSNLISDLNQNQKNSHEQEEEEEEEEEETQKEQKNKTEKTFKRTRAIEELVKTEAIYASDLIIIRDIYLYRSSGPPPSPPPLSATDRQIIFSNIHQLSHLAESFSEALCRANTQNKIGSCFIDFLPKIEKLFTIYCSKYGPANKRLEEFTRKIERKQKKLNKSPSSNFHHHYHPLNHQSTPSHHKTRDDHIGVQYLNECKKLSQGRTSAWDLGSLLIKPVQRCLKYSLLLDQIIKYTEPDDPDLSSLIQARDGMVTVADTINETKRRHEVVGEMISRPSPLGTRYVVRLAGGARQATAWTSPPELTALIGQLRASYKAIDRLPTDLVGSQNAIINWIVAADRLVDAFKNVFALKSGLRRPPSDAAIHLADLDSYQHLVLRGTLNGPLKYLRDRIKKEIIPRIEELKVLYTKPMMLIDKYERRAQQAVVPHGLPSTTTRTSTHTEHSTTSASGSNASPACHASPSSSCSSPSSSAVIPGSEANELREIERFLLDQLPKLISLAHVALNRILVNLFQSIKLYHSDLIILIKKALKL